MRRQVQGLAARQLAWALVDGALSHHRPFSAIDSASAAAMSEVDRAFGMRIARSTLRHLSRSDAVLAPLLKRDPPLPVMNAMRICVNELHAEASAPHAAVHLAVTLVKETVRARHLVGLANAVLRKAADGDARQRWRDAKPPPLPDWMRKQMRGHSDSVIAAIERAHECRPPIDITVRDGRDGKELDAIEGAVRLPTGTIRLPPGQPISGLPGYAAGTMWVQDAAASLPVRMLGELTGRRVLDMCAAPGGKAMQCAAAGAQVTMLDISERRLTQLRENFRRVGLDGEVICCDATQWNTERRFDVVMIDAPCTASGTLRKNPDIAHVKRSKRDFARLSALQMSLLARAATLIAEDGIILYSVCSLLPQEGADILERAAQFGLRTVPPANPPTGIDMRWYVDGAIRTRPDHWPQLGGLDGFFMATLRRM